MYVYIYIYIYIYMYTHATVNGPYKIMVTMCCVRSVSCLRSSRSSDYMNEHRASTPESTGNRILQALINQHMP